jgi:TolB-like protein/Tfp pilus assembly protein PilF
MSSLFEELKRRNVIRVAVFYVVASWLILQVAELLFDALDLPNQWLRLVLALLILGMPLVLILSWVFELTPEGVKREKDIDRSQSITQQTGKRMNTVIIVLLVLAISAVGLDRLMPEPAPSPEPVANTEQTAPPASEVPAQSIAVLPFADLSPAGDQEYFSDGIAEEILNVLVRIEGLKVASRTTSWGFKGQEALGIPYMAEQMKVRHILEGSVRKSGDTIRITAQLIDAQTDQHLWSETFDRKLTAESIFSIQDEIAGAIGKQLGIIIDPAAVASAVRTDTSDLDAYELFLEAQQLFVERRELDRAIALFEQAVAKDPAFARAWAGMAAASTVAPSWNYGARDYFALAADAANKAISLNPDVALAYAVLGNLNRETTISPSFEVGFEYFDKSLALDPRETTTLLWRGIHYMDLGYFDRAEQDFLMCLEIDAGYENCRAHQALAAVYAGDIDRGLALNQESMQNGFTGNFFPLMFVYAARGQEFVAATVLANWNDANNQAAATKFEYRALVDPSYDFEADRPQIEAIYQDANNPWLGWSIHNDDYHFWFREYDKVHGAYYAYWWFQYPKEFRDSEHRKRLMREIGLPEHWRAHGFPPHCRAVGDDDFECD